MADRVPRVRPSPTTAALGKAIRRLRFEHELSQEDLAERAGISFRHLGDIERGERNPSLRIVTAVAAAFELSGSELLRLAEKPERG